MKKTIFLIYIFVSLIILTACIKAPVQKIVSVNIIKYDISDRGTLNEQQICSICKNGYFIAKDATDIDSYSGYNVGDKVMMSGCLDNLKIEVNVQFNNYQTPGYCKTYLNEEETGTIKGGVPAYNGVNSFTIIRQDMKENTIFKVCCGNNGDNISEEKCDEYNIIRRC
jgi:hypothetical protein